MGYMVLSSQDFRAHGWALSVGDIVEGSANVSLDTLGFEPSLPDFPLPEEGVHIR